MDQPELSGEPPAETRDLRVGTKKNCIILPITDAVSLQLLIFGAQVCIQRCAHWVPNGHTDSGRRFLPTA
jgi:hypothetical protein